MIGKKRTRPSIYACGCLDKANKALVPHNTVVVTCYTMDFVTGKQGESLLLHTSKLDSKNRKKALTLYINYCPWCGVKYVN